MTVRAAIHARPGLGETAADPGNARDCSRPPRRAGWPTLATTCLAILAWPAGIAQSTDAPRSSAGTESQPWRGIVKSVHTAALSTDLMTRIAVVGVREGERFRKDAVLFEFDCRRQQHELAALAATLREAKVAVATNAHLVKSGASNRNDVEVAEARLAKADAEWAALQQRLTGCQIKAPFDGVVVELNANAHELPPANKPLMTISSVDRIEIEIIVPSLELARLAKGARIVFDIDETGQRYPATVMRSAGTVDPVSQTAKIYAVFDTPPQPVLPGMSGTAHIAEEGR